MVNQILLQGITLEQLSQSFLRGVDERIQELINKSETPKVRYLTRIEVAELLSISLPTLHDWCKKEILKPYRIGNRVYFKSNELDESLKPIRR